LAGKIRHSKTKPDIFAHIQYQASHVEYAEEAIDLYAPYTYNDNTYAKLGIALTF
jgi:hypothetical protein